MVGVAVGAGRVTAFQGTEASSSPSSYIFGDKAQPSTKLWRGNNQIAPNHSIGLGMARAVRSEMFLSSLTHRIPPWLGDYLGARSRLLSGAGDGESLQNWTFMKEHRLIQVHHSLLFTDAECIQGSEKSHSIPLQYSGLTLRQLRLARGRLNQY
ncbi:hypothetical protein KIL84_015183 [Mauremys mutica]|uniref:Uncharacterized protein n=1 Tax=Mauremys mutica TaxID=74926 RepID=A0A9D3WQB4_9SAUR|nr:hypothetical protein KIL84_015183 [Mauremys mutica]